jgi:hypothetical protein
MVLEVVEHGQIVEQLSYIRMLGPERLFKNGVTAFVLGVTVPGSGTSSPGH